MPLALQKIGVVIENTGTEAVEVAVYTLAEFLEALSIVLRGAFCVLRVRTHRNEQSSRQYKRDNSFHWQEIE